MPDQTREFKITGPLPLKETDELRQTQALRLCVFMNVLQTIYMLFIADDRRSDGSQFDQVVRAGHSLVRVLLLMGVLKEGGDAARDFAAEIDVVIRKLAKDGKIDTNPIAEAWVRVKAAIDNDKNNTASFWNRHLRHARDRAAFHWSRDDIKAVCASEAGKNAPYAIVRDDGDPFTGVRFILADEVLSRVAFPGTTTGQADIRKIVAETQTLAADMICVIGTTVPEFFRLRGCSSQPFEGL